MKLNELTPSVPRKARKESEEENLPVGKISRKGK